MVKIYKFLDRILPYTCLGIFCFLTLSNMLCSSFIYNGEAEAHAWTIAGNASIPQIINLMNTEGHFLIWYLCLIPFAKVPHLYPWAMDLLNWLFCFGALIILWKHAPFNNFTKSCITLSAPFLQVFGTYPRCYSIGILFLFLAMAIYEERTQKPFWYIILLTLAANTSILALFAAGILGILFLTELISAKTQEKGKVLFFAGLIAALNIILFYFQFHNVIVPDYETTEIIKAPNELLGYLGLSKAFIKANLTKMILLWAGTIIFPIVFWQNKKALIFFILSEITALEFFTFIYGARYYHLCFLFIYIIIAFWMLKSEKSFCEKYYWKTISFTILAFFMIFIQIKHFPAILADFIYPITTNSEMLEGTMYSNCEPINLSVILPFLAKSSQTIYDMKGRDLSSYESLKIYFNKSEKAVDPDSFAEVLDTSKRNFLIINGKLKYNYVNGKKYKFNVYLHKIYGSLNSDARIYVYEIKNVLNL
ncbi:hypothetical protein IKE67_08560 [bacterium]|nr:hypothetical protein [bacterium]